MYYYIPQHSWGLVEYPNEIVQGFYSEAGGPCRPVALWCEETSRGAFAHWDDPELITQNLIDWLNNYVPENKIIVYTTQDNKKDVEERINELSEATEFTTTPIENGIWGFTFLGDRAAISVNDILEEDMENLPAEWQAYWPGAPDWKDGSTFAAQFILAVNGFFANYNGRYYFDFNGD